MKQLSVHEGCEGISPRMLGKDSPAAISTTVTHVAIPSKPFAPKAHSAAQAWALIRIVRLTALGAKDILLDFWILKTKN